jgi:hypothetical protein
MRDETKEFLVEEGGDSPQFTIECDRLVPGQSIGFTGNDNLLGVSDQKRSQFKIYPTLLSKGDLLTVENNNTGSKNLRVEIYSMQGKRIYKNKSHNTLKISTSAFNSGIYFILVQNEIASSARRIFIE